VDPIRIVILNRPPAWEPCAPADEHNSGDPGCPDKERSDVNDWTLLIDFGTSFTKAAIADADGRTQPIELDGTLAMPSGIWAESSGRLVAGMAAQRQAKLSPERWDRAPGRWLGLGEQLVLGQKAVDPVKAVAEVLRLIAAEAIRRRGSKPAQVRLTCSPRWNSARRDALLAAAAQAGLTTAGPPQLVDYPVAAALQLARLGRFGVGAKLAMLGLGGGSAEIAVLESTAEGVLIRALGGIEGVGGEQFDDLLFRKVVAHKLRGVDAQLAGRVWEPPDAEWRRASEDLFREVRRAKEELSQQRNVYLDTGPLINVPLQLSRIELEAVLRAEILRSARELATTIELSGLRPRQLNGILLTGGSTRIPLVSRAIFDVVGVHPELLTDPGLYLGAAAWTPQTRVERGPTPLTVAGGQTLEEAAADAAAAAAALAATGSIDLTALTRPRPVISDSADAASGVKRIGLSAWRRRWPVIAGVATVLVAVGLVLNGPASGDDDAGPEPTPTGAGDVTSTPAIGDTGTPTTPAGLEAADLPAVTGLDVSTRNISIDLTWEPVAGAESYTVYRDAGTQEQTLRNIPRTTFTDRPGDGDTHRYSVVAVDDADREGPGSLEVSAEAEAPYGAVQAIASAWTAVVPVTPGKKGTAGQTCKGSSTDAEYANGRIRCTFGNGVRLTILSYDSAADRDRRADQLADRKRVDDGKWSAAQRGGPRLSGRLLTADSKATDGPWRYWTYNTATTYGMYVDWPKHTAKQLSSWWNQKAPFRT
jgi:hypothetical protein